MMRFVLTILMLPVATSALMVCLTFAAYREESQRPQPDWDSVGLLALSTAAANAVLLLVICFIALRPPFWSALHHSRAFWLILISCSYGVGIVLGVLTMP